MTHDYTDEEIKTAWKDSLSLRAFLSALPERPQADEIAALKAALAESEKQFQDKVYEIARLLDERNKAQAELAALRQPILADDGRSLGQVAYDKYTEYARLRSHQQCLELVAQKVAAVALAQAVWRMEAVPVEELCDSYEAANTSFGGMGAVRARLIAAVKGEWQAQEVPQVEAKAEPATFEAHGYTWTRHTPGDPMPCDGGAMVYWLLREELDGDWEYRNLSDYAKDLDWQVIVGWRYADEPAQVQQAAAQPWTPAVGDVVRLKSGGPAMMVTHVDPLSLMCVWMNGSNELQVEPITTLCLTPAKP